METRVIQNSSSIFGQLRAALPDIVFQEAEALEEIWTAVYIRRLPAYTTMKQISTLERIGGMCWFLEQQLHDFPICLMCALTFICSVLAKKNQDIAAVLRQIDDIPTRAELLQYERRFVELYHLVRSKNFNGEKSQRRISIHYQ